MVAVGGQLDTPVSVAMAELVRPALSTAHRLPPSHSRRLNPVEPVRSHLKRYLADLTKHNITEHNITELTDRW